MKARGIVHRTIGYMKQNVLINENDNEQDLRAVIRAEDKELEIFQEPNFSGTGKLYYFKDTSKRKATKT